MQLYEDWDIPGLEDHYRTTAGSSSSASGQSVSSGQSGASGQQTAGGGQAGSGAGLTSENNYTKLTVYNLLDEEVQENEKYTIRRQKIMKRQRKKRKAHWPRHRAILSC